MPLIASLSRRQQLIAGGVALLLVLVATILGTSQPRYLSGDPSGSVPGSKSLGASLVDGAKEAVASMFSGRSPGEREAGLLAMLKSPKHPLVHERVLAKVRQRPRQPSTKYVAHIPPVIPGTPPNAPLYDVVTGAPPVLAANEIPSSPIVAGQPILGSPPGGGGGIFIPPGSGGPVLPPSNPGPPGNPLAPGSPSVPAVPEPSTWLMMLVGFAWIGASIRVARPIHASVSS